MKAKKSLTNWIMDLEARPEVKAALFQEVERIEDLARKLGISSRKKINNLMQGCGFCREFRNVVAEYICNSKSSSKKEMTVFQKICIFF